jgi:hypothetical protein
MMDLKNKAYLIPEPFLPIDRLQEQGRNSATNFSHMVAILRRRDDEPMVGRVEKKIAGRATGRDGVRMKIEAP